MTFCTGSSKRVPLRVVVDLEVGESMDIKLSSGEVVNLKLLAINETRDELRDAVRGAYAKVSVDGTEIIINSGNYNLPVSIGKVQIDCPITRAYYSNSNRDRWGLAKDARFRLWPKDSPYIAPGTFVYPIKQRWFVSDTHMSNEPCYVNGGENPENKKIYYHNGLDFGGSEEMDEVVSASDGLVVSSKGDTLAGYTNFPSGGKRKDGVWVVDDRGWYY
ncbi:metalloendopeptidase, partial [bacterium]|nr:metalloendopeptidase [bacterium]